MGTSLVSRALRLLGLILFSLGAVTAHAADNGFAVYLGGVHSNDSDISGYGTGKGLAVGVDAQFVVNDQWSFNPYLLISSETTGINNLDVINGEGGLQARYWVGSWFLGPQFLFHDTLLKQNGTVGQSLYGPAFGFTFGWEGASGWSVSLQANALENGTTQSVPKNNRSDVLLLVGYRWH